MRSELIYPALIAALSLGSAGCKAPAAASASGPPPAPVRVAPATLKTMPVEVRGVGSVEPISTISVKSQVTGTLVAVHFTEGDAVRQGQLLFEIDPRPYEQAVQQAQANIARDQANLLQFEANVARDEAQRVYWEQQARRYTQLSDEGVFSREQADQMKMQADAQIAAVRADKAAIEAARSAIVADQAALARAKVDLSYCRIVSPIDGRTGNLILKQGNVIKATDVELVTINQVQPVYVSFTTTEKNLPEIRARSAQGKLIVHASLQTDPSIHGDGALTFIDNSVDRTTGTIRLKATFANANVAFWPGQFLDVVLTLREQPNSVVIPWAAIQNGQNGNYVFVMKQDNTVELRPVKTGPKVADLISIESGVSAGERVVTEGQVRLAPGIKVRVLS